LINNIICQSCLSIYAIEMFNDNKYISCLSLLFKGPQITAKHVESTWQQTGHAGMHHLLRKSRAGSKRGRCGRVTARCLCISLMKCKENQTSHSLTIILPCPESPSYPSCDRQCKFRRALVGYTCCCRCGWVV